MDGGARLARAGLRELDEIIAALTPEDLTASVERVEARCRRAVFDSAAG
ncbi:hypothetical protein GCM10009854_22330 [Saccharopolyspora halophila]|uniref:FXSXX-COOH protein n=1 Tax=Saccharopolyspora halophila TaxID=405551 RepID=A0ABN3G6A2_9PSEU